MTYKDIMTDEDNIYDAILKSVSGSKWKTTSQRALTDTLSLIFKIADELSEQTYECKIDDSFTLRERGRLRRIDTFNVENRAIRHLLCDNIFTPLIRQKIIYDNGASVTGRGISHSRKRFEAHLRKYFMHHGSNDGYILFGDFTKYYDNIMHDVAREQLLDLVNHDDYIDWLLGVIFKTFEVDASDLTDDEYISLYEGVLNKLDYDKRNPNATRVIPKSISIGDQLSQCIGIYYPHEIDNYVKIVKSQKYYGRYMDDFYLISDSREELNELLSEIVKIAVDLGIHINLRKTYITKLNSTYKFLQVKYSLTSTGKIIKRINPKRITGIRRKLKLLAKKVHSGEADYDNVENTYKSWMGSFYKLMSRDQRLHMIELYEDLFDKHITIVHHKMFIE